MYVCAINQYIQIYMYIYEYMYICIFAALQVLEQNKKEALAMYKEVSTMYGEADLKPDELLTQVLLCVYVCVCVCACACACACPNVYISCYCLMYVHAWVYMHEFF